MRDPKLIGHAGQDTPQSTSSTRSFSINVATGLGHYLVELFHILLVYQTGATPLHQAGA
ncbi:hypothetical protein Pyn_37432 [Prunus yedoensis var. nudiflora]|uniref:Uncharacterized protein n=1 Tax=Prunus yedoensis var. nudiflora TaxID=2094558 RepID=A0A314YV08_PRUYE|nr:hypothetical protein Pyn_37432 [Prunus yedoensis var. nudiflora]